ncbi:energy-coupling factor transporter transmembrane component T [Propionimicrobium sp. PCR01-08-3]|uniref:energy-coupling factor transporter transmembrane component T family protein n=1 Tax=Propionimicrobium sp. PCR01-08-3 TaxID=3052086 RepID=UPI00255C8690|nr:energy-coupling factor transporter transmembrane component T [Propionimicrobium sp. PCR01-08-3]WIY82533.1 energy-coupling factor transporter transmembrane component T [Propionimicrobium sp. PCR01-08-3]
MTSVVVSSPPAKLVVTPASTKPAMQKTIMGYVPSESPMYRLHPATRLVIYLVSSLVPLFIERPEFNLVVIGLTLAMFSVANVKMGRLKMFLPMLVTVFVILNLTYIFFPREDVSGSSWQFGPVTVWAQSLLWAFCTYCRIAALVLASIFYFSTNRESDILVGMRTLRVPFVVSYFVGLALRSVGIFMEDYQVIKEAEIARGLDTRDLSFTGKIKHFAMNLIPLFSLSIRRSEDISMGLFAKGVRISNKVNGRSRPDWLRTQFRMKPFDWTLAIGLVALLLGAAVIAFATPLLSLGDSVFALLIPGGLS